MTFRPNSTMPTLFLFEVTSNIILFAAFFSTIVSPGANADCSDPELPKDGWRSSPDKHQFKTGDVIHYYCKTNYTLRGSPKVICLASGRWDTKPPSCIDPCDTCENGGICVYSTTGRNFHCICKQGFRDPNCGTPYCTPPQIANGGFHVTPPDGGLKFDVESTVLFVCDQDYIIQGTNDGIKCSRSPDGSAQWDRKFPICTEKKCKNMFDGGTMPNGKYVPVKSKYAFGDIVSFSCKAGFKLQGQAALSCMRDGYWTSVLWPQCIGRKCLRPASIAHGRIIQESEDFPAGSIIRFECKTGDGYYLFGPEQQKCMPDSNGDMRWSPKRPLCITKNRFEEYCALQNKVMTLDPTPGCMTRLHVNGGTTSTRRNSSIDTLTIVTGTAGGLLGFLLVIIAFVIYQRRRLVRRMRRATTRRMRSSEDERMLIYCSNDFHFFLPTYDEAVRSRSAEPPPFDAVVSNGGDATQTSNPVTTSPESEEAANVTSSSPVDSERQYESIDNIIATVNTDLANNQTERDEHDSSSVVVDEYEGACTGSVSSQDSTVDENRPLV